MSSAERVTAALADRYRIERELGAGRLKLAAKSRGSAAVAEATLTIGPPDRGPCGALQRRVPPGSAHPGHADEGGGR